MTIRSPDQNSRCRAVRHRRDSHRGGRHGSGRHWAPGAPQQPSHGIGTYSLRVCVPNCAQGKTVTFPILAALWLAKPLPGDLTVR